jgi:segregation and condensation protein B
MRLIASLQHLFAEASASDAVSAGPSFQMLGRPREPIDRNFKWSFFRTGRPAEAVFPPEAEDDCRRTPPMARLEAVLLVADGPLSLRRLVQYATLADVPETRRLIERLNAAYDRSRSAFRIERLATGYQLLTRPEFSFWLNKLHQRQAELKLSAPAMETLAIVAYRQPIIRADVESIRGVQCAEMLKQLMDRGLVRIAGEDDSLGRPFLYQTTRRFLEVFGLQSLDDLPMADQLRPPPDATTDGEPEDVSDDASDLSTDDEPEQAPEPCDGQDRAEAR